MCVWPNVCVFCDAKNPLDLLCSAVQVKAGRLRGPVWRMRRLPFREITILEKFDDMQKYVKEHMDSTKMGGGQVAKGGQASVYESADYFQTAFDVKAAVV